MARRHDIVLYGATGFVGRQTVAYLAAHGGGLRWALAGRSAERLEAARGANDADIVVADAADEAALSRLASGARVVLSTAGPFARHGSALVAACVAARTDYVDITGETPWVRAMIDAHHGRAERDGTRIVPGCGFDSVPSDLGAWLLVQALRARGERCLEAKAAFALAGGVNGGTLASMFEALDRGQRGAFDDPFLLNPPESAPGDAAAHADPIAPHHDADFGAWVGPFFMGPVNTRVVRRSAALLGYGDDFRYQEYLRFGSGPLAAVAAAGAAFASQAAQGALAFAPVRQALKAVVPSPGEGPSEAAMDGGWFRCELVARGDRGSRLRGRIADRGDPGNRATTTFVCEAALLLAEGRGARRGGVLTPAAALGEAYARRLRDAGMTVEPLDGEGGG